MEQNRIVEAIKQSIALKQQILTDKSLLQSITDVTDAIINTFQAKGKVLFCGNGGSAADAQHLAAEFSGRFYYDRDPLYSEALHVNTSYITAVANDYSYNEIYSRLIKAKGAKGDVLVGISTSGNSENIIRAINTANDLGMITVGFTGNNGGKMKDICKYIINVPSNDTPRIQEVHILIGHIVCELVEAKLFPI
ncbi:MAG: D-sedoheptulose 7-phosphate isomerase [Bacteroidota bacterium]